MNEEMSIQNGKDWTYGPEIPASPNQTVVRSVPVAAYILVEAVNNDLISATEAVELLDDIEV